MMTPTTDDEREVLAAVRNGMPDDNGLVKVRIEHLTKWNNAAAVRLGEFLQERGNDVEHASACPRAEWLYVRGPDIGAGAR